MKWPALAYLIALPPAKLAYYVPPPEAIAASRMLEISGVAMLGAIALWPLWPSKHSWAIALVLFTVAAICGAIADHSALFRGGRIGMDAMLVALITSWVADPLPHRRRLSDRLLCGLCLAITAYNFLEIFVCYLLAPIAAVTDQHVNACARLAGTWMMVLPVVIYTGGLVYTGWRLER